MQSFWNMLSEKGEKQNKFVIYLLLIEVLVLVLILGVTGNGELAVALGTISMALAIVYVEIIKPWLQKPEIKIEFKNKPPFCRKVTERRTSINQYHIRLKIKNEGQSIAKKLRGKLVEVTRKDGSPDKDFDPLFLHWTAKEPKPTEISSVYNWANILDPIDLYKKEYDFLDIFFLIEGEEKDPKKAIRIGHTNFPRGCLKEFGISKIENTFKITIYGENIEPATETYKLKWDGEAYNEIEMCKIDQKEREKSSEKTYSDCYWQKTFR